MVGEKARGNIHRDHVCWRIIDLPDDLGVEASHWFVQPNTEKRIHDKVVLIHRQLTISCIVDSVCIFMLLGNLLPALQLVFHLAAEARAFGRANHEVDLIADMMFL